MDTARRIKTAPISAASIPLKLRVRTHLGGGVQEFIKNRTNKPVNGFITAEVQAIRVGDLALVTAPGEMFAEIVTRMEKNSPFRHTIVVAHANDAIGYIFTDKAAFEGGYEVLRGSISENMEQPYFATAMQALQRTLKK
jgi:hypothetical protein